MAKISETQTRVSNFKGYIPKVTLTSRPTDQGPHGLRNGLWVRNATTNCLEIYYNGKWYGAALTTTSTSTTTTISTSTTTS